MAIKTSLNVPIREPPVYGRQDDAEYSEEQAAKERQPGQKGRQRHGKAGGGACKVANMHFRLNVTLRAV